MNKELSKLNRILFGVLFLFLIVSCSENEEIQHVDVVNWVEKNKVKVQEYSREKIIEMPVIYQKHILKILEPENKKRIWLDKMDHVLNLDLTKEEVGFIEWFKLKISLIDYRMPDKDGIDQVLYEKLIEGMKKFEWSREFAYIAFFSIENVNLENITQQTVFTQEGEEICSCRYSLSCPWFRETCRSPEDGCHGGYDCGFAGTSECTGICS